MIRRLSLWIWLPGHEVPTPMGVFEHQAITADTGLGTFAYLDSYLSLGESVPACPGVPLDDRIYETTRNGGYFGFLLDAGPDAWGKRIIDAVFGRQDTFGYLERSNKAFRVGALGISAEHGDIEPSSPPKIRDVDLLLSSAKSLESGGLLSEEVKQLLRAGVSLGGARPKALIYDEDHYWIAKFPATKDLLLPAPVPRLEAAMLSLAKTSGIETVDYRLIEVGGEPVLLVKRFDIQKIGEGKFGRLRYASGRTAQELPGVMPSFTGSYPLLARTMDVWSENARQDKRALFRRLVFNIAICNTDDHELNHGFVDRPGLESLEQLSLSPAFDLAPNLPTSSKVYQAMQVGEWGAESSYENAVSAAPAYGLSPNQAWEVVKEVEQCVRDGWQEALKDAGCDASQIQSLSACFERLPPVRHQPGRGCAPKG